MPAVLVEVITAAAARVSAVIVTAAAPETLTAVALALTKLAMVLAVPAPVMLMVVMSVSMVNDVPIVAPVRFTANAVLAAVVKAPKVPALTVVNVPPKFKVVSAPESTDTAAALAIVTFVMVPAAVAEARFTSLTVTAPLTTPRTPVIAATDPEAAT